MKLLLFSFIILFYTGVFGQEDKTQLSVLFGYTSIPLKIERTHATMWMIFPSFQIGYKIKPNIELQGSYLLHDIRLAKLSGDKFHYYSEVPKLNSYEEAKMYIGKKLDPSEFYTYVFLGAEDKYFNSRAFKDVAIGAQIGIRGGYTFILEHIFENSQYPNGFEAHLSIANSNSIGLRLHATQKFQFLKHFIISPTFGVYIFTNWPALQGFINLQGGFQF